MNSNREALLSEAESASSSWSEAESKGGSESDNDSLFNYGSRSVSPMQDTGGPRRWRPSPPPEETWDDVDIEWGYKIVGEEVDYDGVTWYEVRWDDWARPDGTKTTWHRADDKETEIQPSQWIAEQSKKRQGLAQQSLGVDLPRTWPSGGSPATLNQKYTLSQIPFASPALAVHLLPTWYQSQAFEDKLHLAQKQRLNKGGIPSRLAELAEMREKRKKRTLNDKSMTEEERSAWLAVLNGPSLGTFGSSQLSQATSLTSMQSVVQPTQSQSTQAGSSTQGAFNSFFTEEDTKLTPRCPQRQAIVVSEKATMKTFTPIQYIPSTTAPPPPVAHIPPPTVSPKLPSHTQVPPPAPLAYRHHRAAPNPGSSPTHRIISSNIPVVKFPKALPLPAPKPNSDPFSRSIRIPVTPPVKREETTDTVKPRLTVRTNKPKTIVEVVPPPLPAWARRLDPEHFMTLSLTRNTSIKGKGKERPEDTIRRLLSEKWSSIASSAPILIKNEIDDELLPLDDTRFTYVEGRYMLDKGVQPTDTGFLLPCSCTGKCNASTCSCHGLSATPLLDRGKPVFAYTGEGLFAFNQPGGEEVVECNPLCSCSQECSNRLSQRPRDFPVEIFKTKKRGWGARSSVAIPRGKVLGLYTGLMIMREKAKEIPEEEEGYYFDLDHDEWDSATAHHIVPEHEQFTVDSRAHGNWTRFINHSCSPNLAVYTVVRDVPPSAGKGFITFYATTNIPPYTEFTVDYDPNSNNTLILLRDKLYKAPPTRKKGKKKGRNVHASRGQSLASASASTSTSVTLVQGVQDIKTGGSVYHETWQDFVEARMRVGDLEASIRCGCDDESCRGYIYVHLKD